MGLDLKRKMGILHVMFSFAQEKERNSPFVSSVFGNSKLLAGMEKEDRGYLEEVEKGIRDNARGLAGRSGVTLNNIEALQEQKLIHFFIALLYQEAANQLIPALKAMKEKKDFTEESVRSIAMGTYFLMQQMQPFIERYLAEGKIKNPDKEDFEEQIEVLKTIFNKFCDLFDRLVPDLQLTANSDKENINDKSTAVSAEKQRRIEEDPFTRFLAISKKKFGKLSCDNLENDLRKQTAFKLVEVDQPGITNLAIHRAMISDLRNAINALAHKEDFTEEAVSNVILLYEKVVETRNVIKENLNAQGLAILDKDFKDTLQLIKMFCASLASSIDVKKAINDDSVMREILNNRKDSEEDTTLLNLIFTVRSKFGVGFLVALEGENAQDIDNKHFFNAMMKSVNFLETAKETFGSMPKITPLSSSRDALEALSSDKKQTAQRVSDAEQEELPNPDQGVPAKSTQNPIVKEMLKEKDEGETGAFDLNRGKTESPLVAKAYTPAGTPPAQENKERLPQKEFVSEAEVISRTLIELKDKGEIEEKEGRYFTQDGKQVVNLCCKKVGDVSMICPNGLSNIEIDQLVEKQGKYMSHTMEKYFEGLEQKSRTQIYKMFNKMVGHESQNEHKRFELGFLKERSGKYCFEIREKGGMRKAYLSAEQLGKTLVSHNGKEKTLNLFCAEAITQAIELGLAREKNDQNEGKHLVIDATGFGKEFCEGVKGAMEENLKIPPNEIQKRYLVNEHVKGALEERGEDKDAAKKITDFGQVRRLLGSAPDEEEHRSTRPDL